MNNGQDDSKADALLGCDEIEAAVRRLRERLNNAESYKKQAFYESVECLYDEIALAFGPFVECFRGHREGFAGMNEEPKSKGAIGEESRNLRQSFDG